MEHSEFNNHFLTNLLDNPSAENKAIVLLGDFKPAPLKYDKDCNVSDFLNAMYSNLLPLHMAYPARITINL